MLSLQSSEVHTKVGQVLRFKSRPEEVSFQFRKQNSLNKIAKWGGTELAKWGGTEFQMEGLAYTILAKLLGYIIPKLLAAQANVLWQEPLDTSTLCPRS